MRRVMVKVPEDSASGRSLAGTCSLFPVDPESRLVHADLGVRLSRAKPTQAWLARTTACAAWAKPKIQSRHRGYGSRDGRCTTSVSQKMASTAQRHICPFWEPGSLGGSPLLGGRVVTLRGVVGLPGALGVLPCGCRRPGMRLLPDGVFYCPACGAEVLPVGDGAPSELGRS